MDLGPGGLDRPGPSGFGGEVEVMIQKMIPIYLL
jgi:hypothetical protein